MPAANLAVEWLQTLDSKVSSSRKSETECVRNVELMWLTTSLMPCYRL